MKIAFLVGDHFGMSGGSNVIIEYAAGLSRRGHQVVIVSGTPIEPGRGGWHPQLAALQAQQLAVAGRERFDFAFATWWLTWFDLGLIDSGVYGYLNQSLESRFRPEPARKALNRLTYSLPLLFVTEAHWIAEFIGMVQPGGRTIYVRNGLSRDFFPTVKAPPLRSGPLRVLVEGPWDLEFKGVREAFELLRGASSRASLTIGWLTSGSSGVRPRVAETPVRIHERIPINHVRYVYQQYDVLLKLSRVEGMYGPPLEMFSQGGTVISYDVTGCDEYVVHGVNGLLVEPYNREQVVAYLELLQQRPGYLAFLRRNALRTAESYPEWAESCDQLAHGLEQLSEEGFDNSHLRATLANQDRRVERGLS